MSTTTKRKAAVFKAAAIAPRKHETDEIVALLDSDEFDSAAQMARKVMSTAFALMAERNWFVVGSRLDGGPGTAITLYGFFATESAAMKAIDQNSLGLFGEAAVFEVVGLSGRAEQLEKHEDALSKECVHCGHIEAAHDWPRRRAQGCIVAHCGCRTYTKPEPDVAPIEAI